MARQYDLATREDRIWQMHAAGIAAVEIADLFHISDGYVRAVIRGRRSLEQGKQCATMAESEWAGDDD